MGKSHETSVYKSLTVPQSQVVTIFLSMAAYDANLPSQHTAQNVVQCGLGKRAGNTKSVAPLSAIVQAQLVLL